MQGLKERYLKKQIISDLDQKMVFLAGPRQVGKTTMSKNLNPSSLYLNWDVDADRTVILSKQYKKADLIIFDEIHKYSTWRNYLKGLYDGLGQEQKILVTGSAKLDLLRKGGDSLQGRYFFMRLMPLSFSELKMSHQNDLISLYNLSGFPEPFFKGSKSYVNRWSKLYSERIVRQEISSTELVQNLGDMEVLMNRLPDLVGSGLSINSICEDIQVTHKTLANWLNIFEKLYSIFRISPFGSPQIKALKKQQKLYFFDWNNVVDEGARFENLMAVHLLKWIFYMQDVEGRKVDLRYYSDKQGREVDFVITENNKPIQFIEVKLSDAEVGKGLMYLKGKFPLVPSFQVHLKGKKEYINQQGIEVVKAYRFLKGLV
jgi:predicted AAA+ superfamily ATPase